MQGCRQILMVDRRWPGCTAFCAVLAAAAIAAGAQPSDRPDRESVGGQQSWEAGDVHLQSSRVYIHVGKTGLGHEHAVEGQLKSGELHLDGDAPSGELVFDMTTFSAETDSARRYVGLTGVIPQGTRDGVNGNMLGPKVLDVRQHPTATFKLTNVSALPEASSRGLPQYRIQGQFTLHGATRAIGFTADAESEEGWTHLQGGFAVRQSDFGITPFSMAFGTVGVADKITIWGDLWIAERSRTAAASTDAVR